jgi:hypothetical protein
MHACSAIKAVINKHFFIAALDCNGHSAARVRDSSKIEWVFDAAVASSLHTEGCSAEP